MKKYAVLGWTYLLLCCASTTSVRAGQVTPATPIVGQSGKVVIGERASSSQFGTTEYLVDVLGSAEVHAFAVSGNVGTDVYSTRNGWNEVSLTEADWTSGFDFTIGDNASSNDVATYGSYESLFGEDLRVSFYWRGAEGSAIVEASDQDQGGNDFWLSQFAQFGVHAEQLSEFIAIGGSGQLIDASNILIPEPSSSALAGMAMAGLIGVARRRRK